MNNKLWTGVIVIAFLLPIVAMAYEMVRASSLVAVGVFAALVLVWIVVMWLAARVPSESPPSRNHIPPLKPYATASSEGKGASRAAAAADKKTPRGRRA